MLGGGVTPSRYRPVDSSVYPRFAGIRTFMRLPHVTDLAGVDAAAVGIPFDTATSFRPGARFGPEAIRSASVLLRPYHPALDVDVLEALSIVDYGDLPVAPGDTEGTYRRIEAALAPLVEAGVFPLVLGGDHSITLPELRALARRHGPMALVQLDSHTDTWDEYFDHALLPRNDVQAGGRRGADRAGRLGAGRDARLALRCSRISTMRGRSGSRSSRARSSARSGRRATREQCARGSATGRSSSRSTSTSSTPRSRPARARPRSPASRPPRRSRCSGRLRGMRLVGCDVVEVAPPYDGPGSRPRSPRRTSPSTCSRSARFRD